MNQIESANPLDVPEVIPEESKEDPEIAELRKMQEFFITSNRDVFEQVSKNANLRIQPGKGFRIIFDKPLRIELDSKDWKEMREGKFTDEQMIWSTMHEIAHFLDMMDDPQGMMGHFDYMKKVAQNNVGKARSIWKNALRAKGEDLPDFVTDDFLNKFLYEQISKFYNCLDDVYVNNLVATKLPYRYSPGRGVKAEVVSKLYSDYLFKDDDLRGLPKSKQLGYAILRRKMVKDQETDVSPEINEFLSREKNLNTLLTPSSSVAPREKQNTPTHRYRYLRSQIEPEFWKLFWEDIKNFPPPKQTTNESGEGENDEGGEEGEFQFEPGMTVKDKNTGEIGKITAVNDDGTVEVNYSEMQVNNRLYQNPNDELIVIIEGKPPKGKSNKSQNAPHVEYTEESDDIPEPIEPNNGNPWEDNNKRGPIDGKTIKDFLESKEKYNEEHNQPETVIEPKLSPEAIYRETKIKIDANLAEQYGKLSPEQARLAAEEWAKYYESIQPYINQMTEVFDEILNTINVQIQYAWQEGFRSGRLNIDHFIQKYGGELATGAMEGTISRFIDFNQLDTFDQREFTSRLQIFPNNIVFRLILDNSGSMMEQIGEGDEKFPKILYLKQLMVLLYESLTSFQERIRQNFRLNNSFVVDIEAQVFSTDTVLAKPLGKTDEESRGLMIATLAFLNGSGRGTNDAQAWENISTKVKNDPDWQEKIKNGETQDIAIEITDGDSQSAEETNAMMRDYMDTVGAGSANGIKITNPNETPEQYQGSTFNKIFQGNGQAVKGPHELATAFSNLLSEKLKEMQKVLKIKQEKSADFE